MAKFTIEIETDNEAFGDDPRAEVARILIETAELIASRGMDLLTTERNYLRDVNGNRVGSLVFVE